MTSETGASEAVGPAETASDGVLPPRLRLVMLAFLMLFLELALIRWMGSNLVYLSYFSNFVLLGSFLGIGLGFLRADARVNLFPWSPVALLGLVAFVFTFPVEIDRSGSDLIFFGGHTSGAPIWLVLPVVFVAVALVLMMVGEGVARTFKRFENLEAYRLDIGGSILGIVGFSLLSFLRAPPVVWGLVVAVLFVVLLAPSVRAVQVVAVVGLVGLLGIESLQPNLSWSPYYEVESFEPEELPGTLAINVNGIPHQTMVAGEMRRSIAPLTDVYELSTGDPGRVLIIGAGNGVDVATALEEGADAVTAVEIDPRIRELGDLNPDQPYADERTTTIIDDGRAVLERSDETWDRIILALPDSLSLVSGQSSLRLESYLFTEEAIEAAKERLAPGGVFAMYNSYRERWLVDRFGGTLEEVFGQAPCMELYGEDNFGVLVVSEDPGSIECREVWTPAGAVPAASTDDRPFPYLREPGIPSFYLVALAALVAVSLVAVRLVGGSVRPMVAYADLFLMGVAFLLLETKSVVQFALLFGTTWLVNSFVFAGVLVSIYLAIEVSRRVVVRRIGLLYALLLVAIAVAWSVPGSALLELAGPARFVAAVVVSFTPIFIANLVFAQRFRDVGSSTTAFGANLLGAVVGGVLEYLALLTGYRALLIVVALCYGGAFLLERRRQGLGDAAPGEAPAPAS